MFVHRYAGQDVCESHGWYRRAPLDLTFKLIGYLCGIQCMGYLCDQT